jgi:hypothetical protein
MLHLGGTVKVIIDVIPRGNIYFLTDKGETQTKVLTLKNLDKSKKMEILKIINPLKGFEVNHEPFSLKRWTELMEFGDNGKMPPDTWRPDGGDYLITVKVTPDAIGGRLKEVIKILTNIEKKPEIHIEIQGRIQGPMVIVPNFLNLERVPVKLENPKIKEFTLKHDKKEKFTIKDIRADDPFFSFEYKSQPDNSFRLKISYNGGLEPGRHYGYIYITTDCVDHPVIDLRYNGWVVTPDEMAGHRNKKRPSIQQRGLNRTPVITEHDRK